MNSQLEEFSTIVLEMTEKINPEESAEDVMSMKKQSMPEEQKKRGKLWWKQLIRVCSNK